MESKSNKPTLKDIIFNYSDSMDTLRGFVRSTAVVFQQRPIEVESLHHPELYNLFETALAIAKRNPDIWTKQLGDVEADSELRKLFEFDSLEVTKNEADFSIMEFYMNRRSSILSRSTPEPLSEAVLQAIAYLDLLYKGSLITLVSTVELFLSDLLHFYFDQCPEAAALDTKFFSFNDVKSFATVQDARQFLIESTVEKILKGSLEDRLKYLKNKLKLSMVFIYADKEELIAKSRGAQSWPRKQEVVVERV